MNKEKIKEMLPWVIGGLLMSSGIAYGFANNSQEFLRYLVLALIGFFGLFYWLSQKQRTNDRVAELEGLLEQKKTDERVEVLEKMLEGTDAHIAEQEDVIKNYEMMLEEASVKFPCNCGQNMFDGIFKPEEEVVVECEYCKAKYAVILKLDKVLISETEDLTIEQIIKE